MVCYGCQRRLAAMPRHTNAHFSVLLTRIPSRGYIARMAAAPAAPGVCWRCAGLRLCRRAWRCRRGAFRREQLAAAAAVPPGVVDFSYCLPVPSAAVAFAVLWRWRRAQTVIIWRTPAASLFFRYAVLVMLVAGVVPRSPCLPYPATYGCGILLLVLIVYGRAFPCFLSHTVTVLCALAHGYLYSPWRHAIPPTWR